MGGGGGGNYCMTAFRWTNELTRRRPMKTAAWNRMSWLCSDSLKYASSGTERIKSCISLV